MKAAVLMATPCTKSLGGEREKVGFIENTARRHRGSGCREATVASRLTDRYIES